MHLLVFNVKKQLDTLSVCIQGQATYWNYVCVRSQSQQLIWRMYLFVFEFKKCCTYICVCFQCQKQVVDTCICLCSMSKCIGPMYLLVAKATSVCLFIYFCPRSKLLDIFICLYSMTEKLWAYVSVCIQAQTNTGRMYLFE